MNDSVHLLVSALNPLVGASVSAKSDVQTRTAPGRQLVPQHVDDVRLHDDLAVEVVTGIHFKPFVRSSSKTIYARMAASPIGIKGIGKWHRRFAGDVVERALGSHLVERQTGELRHLH